MKTFIKNTNTLILIVAILLAPNYPVYAIVPDLVSGEESSVANRRETIIAMGEIVHSQTYPQRDTVALIQNVIDNSTPKPLSLGSVASEESIVKSQVDELFSANNKIEDMVSKKLEDLLPGGDTALKIPVGTVEYELAQELVLGGEQINFSVITINAGTKNLSKDHFLPNFEIRTHEIGVIRNQTGQIIDLYFKATDNALFNKNGNLSDDTVFVRLSDDVTMNEELNIKMGALRKNLLEQLGDGTLPTKKRSLKQGKRVLWNILTSDSKNGTIKFVRSSPIAKWLLSFGVSQEISYGVNFLAIGAPNTGGQYLLELALVEGGKDHLIHELTHVIYDMQIKGEWVANEYNVSEKIRKLAEYFIKERQDLMMRMRSIEGYSERIAKLTEWCNSKDVDEEATRFYVDVKLVIHEVLSRLLASLDSLKTKYEGLELYGEKSLGIKCSDIEAVVEAGLVPDWYSPKRIGYEKRFIEGEYNLKLAEYCLNHGKDLALVRNVIQEFPGMRVKNIWDIWNPYWSEAERVACTQARDVEATFLSMLDARFLAIQKNLENKEKQIRLEKEKGTLTEAKNLSELLKDKKPVQRPEELSLKEKKPIWSAINELHTTRVEVITTVQLTSSLQKDIVNISAANRTRVKDSSAGDILTITRINQKEELIKKSLLTELKKQDPSVKRIILADESLSQAINKLKEDNRNLEYFRDVRIIRLELPENYAALPQITNTISAKDLETVYQTQAIEAAVYARLLRFENGKFQNLMIKIALETTLENCFFGENIKLENFLTTLASEETEATSTENIIKRLNYFLDPLKAIKLINVLGQELFRSQQFLTLA